MPRWLAGARPGHHDEDRVRGFFSQLISEVLPVDMTVADAELNERGIGSSNDGDLIRLLNEERKSYAYDGDEPEFNGDTAEQIAARVEDLVVAAEEAWSDA